MADLEQFIADDDERGAGRLHAWEAPVLVLSFGGMRYGVLAESVENVMPYRDPARVPHAKPALAGILQDRGRMLALVRHPSGAAEAAPPARPTRVVVCKSRAGRLGLPASQTHTIRILSSGRRPTHGDLLEDGEGAVTYLDVELVVASVRSGSE